jgi:hypothetical protein
MNKTKIRVSPSLQEYCQTMAQWVNEAREEKLWITEKAEINLDPIPMRKDIPAPEKAGLLIPPWIELLWPEIYMRNGESDGLIMINTSDVFGIEYIYVTLRDEAGNLLESGYAMRTGVCGHWGYPSCVDLAVGTSVLVRAVAVDTLGGMGVAHEKCTVQDALAR